MIRINLLNVEKDRAKKKSIGFGSSTQKLTIGCSLILVMAAMFMGWRYWSLERDSGKVDGEIAAAQKETTRLHSVIQQVQQFEQRRAQLQQRVVLIEQLRKGQAGPVHMLDEVSRALPPMLWLTELRQSTAAADPKLGNTVNDVFIDGSATSLTGLSDFVANLEATGYFKRSIEIVSTTTEQLTTGGELIKFSIKAVFQPPVEQKAAPAPTAAPARKVGG